MHCAITFPDGNENHNIPALFLLSIYTDEQNNSDKKSQKRVKLGSVIKKLNSFWSKCQWLWSHFTSSVTVLLFHLWENCMTKSATLGWSNGRFFSSWVSTQEHSFNHRICSIDILKCQYFSFFCDIITLQIFILPSIRHRNTSQLSWNLPQNSHV